MTRNDNLSNVLAFLIALAIFGLWAWGSLP